jgi:hypothetical protein
MSVRTLWRFAALTLLLSVLLGPGLANAQQRVSETILVWESPGHGTGWIDPSGDPDGVQGCPPPSRKSGAGLGVTPVPDPRSPSQGVWRAVWAHWLTGLLQRIGYRY